MDAKRSSSTILLLAINLLFFTLRCSEARGLCQVAEWNNWWSGREPSRYSLLPVLSGLVDLEAAVCLCTAIKANVLGINIDIPISLSLLINTCGKKLPSDFICA
ncbi:hypothetical protein CRYUN_Cryun13aG0133600 [Craigia yunnanensis]